MIFDEQILETVESLDNMLLKLVLNYTDHRFVVDPRFHLVLGVVTEHLQNSNELL